VDSVIAHCAEEVGAQMETADTPLPPCRWNAGDVGDRSGVRMSAAVQEREDGSFRIALTVRCERDAGHYLGGFLQSIIYPFQYVDGEWRRVGDAVTIITWWGM
jgi:hypothetical protein